MIDTALKAIAEPRRREILTLIKTRELSVGEIAARFDVSRPAISQHLAVLKDARLVTERQDGTRRYFRADNTGLRDVRAFVESFWPDRLERLKQAAESEHKQRRKS